MFQLNLSENDTALELAEAYHTEGYSVVPLLRANKRPLEDWKKYQYERPTEEQIQKWFTNRDDLVVALVCGDFLVVDADSPESMDWVEKNLPPSPFRVITSKGMHFYYNNPQNFSTFATKRTATTPIERHIDIRGTGGLIVAPHNRHASGAIYKPVTFPDWKVMDVTDLPDFTDVEWQKVTGVAKTETQTTVSPFSLDGVNEGSRNDQAARLAGYLISKNINQEFVKFFLQSWNTNNNPPLPQKEVDTVVRSVRETHDRKNAKAPLFVSYEESIPRPKDLFNPPGLVKDMFEYCEQIAQVSQPELSMVGALSLASVSCGRIYSTNINNFSSLFFMGIAKSGQGKENIKTFVERNLNASNHSALLVGDGYTSSGAVHSILKYRPTQITIMDEFGKRLEAISNQSNSNREDGLQTLMEAWGRCHGTLRPDNYSMMNVPEQYREQFMNRITHKPAITLVGLSVPKNFYRALNSGRIADGFLNRFIVVESKEPRKMSALKESSTPPKKITDWIDGVRYPKTRLMATAINNAEMDFKQQVLKFDDLSKELLNDLARDIVKRQDILEKDNLEPLLSRTREKAMRLSLCCALADNVNAETISGDITKWCIDYVNYYDSIFIEACRDKVASSATESKIKQVLNFIRSRNGDGISKREVDRHELFRSMKSHEVKEIIDRLINAGEIQEVEIKVGGKGRPAKRFVAVDPNYFEE